jgi:hypothetical protein
MLVVVEYFFSFKQRDQFQATFVTTQIGKNKELKALIYHTMEVDGSYFPTRYDESVGNYTRSGGGGCS